MRVISSFVFAVATMSLVACGGDDDSSTPDAPEVNPATCTVSALNFGDKGALTAQSSYSEGGTPGVGGITVLAALEGAAPSDLLIIELIPGFAPFGTTAAPTAVAPGTYQMTGEQLNYKTCGTCIRILTNFDDQGEFEDQYLVTGGTLNVTAVDNSVGGTLTFSVSNLVFEHVTVAADFTSTPTNDGCHARISNATSTSTLAGGDANKLGAVFTRSISPRVIR